MIQIPASVGAALLVLDVLGVCWGGVATLRETRPLERGRHRAR